jgi:NADPH:quinone reductase-like Zn-dependent oxidoreductase
MKSIPYALSSDHNETGLMVHPAAMDGCLQLSAVIHIGSDSIESSSNSGGAYVPAGFGAFCVPETTNDMHMYALAESVRPLSNGSSVVTNHVLQRTSGVPVAVLSELEAKQMGARPVGRSQVVAEQKELLYEVSWQCHTTVSSLGAPAQAQDLSGLTLLLEQNTCEMAVEMPTNPGLNASMLVTEAVMSLLQQAPDGASGSSKFVALVMGCLPSSWPSTGSSLGNWSSGSVLGLIRTLAQERPRQEMHGLDIDMYAPIDWSAKSLTAPLQDLETSIRQNTWLQNRLLHARVSSSLPHSQLVPSPRGSLSSLAAHQLDSSVESEGMVFLQVMAVGLNFRDVLNVLGAYPGDPGPPGSDMSGVVSRVWDSSLQDVPDALQVGVRVAGLAPGCLGTHAYTFQQLVVPIPKAASFVEACTMVTVFMTVDVAMCHAACLPSTLKQPVFVHAAAGGIGLAACQVVHALGAEMWATAGSSLKRHLLRSMGVRHVVSSRSLDYASLGQTAHNGQVEGMGLILNSLTSSGMVGASLSSLHLGGQLVEIGKRDIWSSAGVHRERPDVVYSLLAVDFLPPARTHQALCRLASGIAEGVVAGLRSTCHTLNNTQAALRWLAGAKHVGKVVVTKVLAQRAC